MYDKASLSAIEHVTWPQDFDGATFFHDIALVELSSTFQWSSSVKPACLAHSENDGYVEDYGKKLMVTFLNNLIFSDRLRLKLLEVFGKEIGDNDR